MSEFPWIPNLKSQVFLQNSSSAVRMSFIDILNIKTDTTQSENRLSHRFYKLRV